MSDSRVNKQRKQARHAKEVARTTYVHTGFECGAL